MFFSSLLLVCDLKVKILVKLVIDVCFYQDYFPSVDITGIDAFFYFHFPSKYRRRRRFRWNVRDIYLSLFDWWFDSISIQLFWMHIKITTQTTFISKKIDQFLWPLKRIYNTDLKCNEFKASQCNKSDKVIGFESKEKI